MLEDVERTVCVRTDIVANEGYTRLKARVA